MNIQEATEIVYQGLHGQKLGNRRVHTVRNTFKSPSLWEWEVYCCPIKKEGIEITAYHTLSLDTEELGLSCIEDIMPDQLKLEVHRWLFSTDRWLGGNDD